MDTDILNPFERDYQTDDVLSPRVVAFVNEVQSTRTTREDAWRLHHVLKGQRLNLTPGWTLETLDTVSVYAELPVPEGHDHPEVRDFIARCVQAIEVFERYDGSADNRIDNAVENVIALRSGRNTSDECNAAREALPEALKEEGLSRGDLRIRVRAEMDAQALASIQERLSVSAGQAKISDISEGPDSDPDGYERNLALTCADAKEAKRKAEAHRHKRSRDWDKAPGGTREHLFTWITKQDGPVYVTDIPRHLDPDGKRLAWMRKRRYLIHVCQDGEILVMPDWNDPRWNPDYDPAKRFLGDGTDTWKYPGWTSEKSAHPKAGHAQKTAHIRQDAKAYLIARHREGYHPDPKTVTAYLNEFKRPEGSRFLSVDRVRQVLKELHESGELALLKKADRWRSGHGWINVPAQYCHPDEVPEGIEPIAPEIKFARLAERIRVKMRQQEAPAHGLAA
ncbi:hypothetical protein [Actinomadura geliboluensis]|uniref:hypothetical protein n=1 Tax=Actinomadura geliboluensis TaxID=882440 RepID=UPI0036BFD6C7